MDAVNDVRKNYDENVHAEWNRLDRHPAEFYINLNAIKREIQPGNRVLDIGGGSGRYALSLAEAGCDVTLFDLSQGNVDFGLRQAAQLGLPLKAVCGDARLVDTAVSGPFDVVLLMGPLYHLPEEADRVLAVETALRLLKPGGVFFASFISAKAPVWDYLTRCPEHILLESEQKFISIFTEDLEFSGPTFTQTHFIRPGDVAPFMARFPLQQKRLFSSESILSLCDPALLTQPPEVLTAWLALAEQVCEREDALHLAQHFLYVGRKEAL